MQTSYTMHSFESILKNYFDSKILHRSHFETKNNSEIFF